MCDVFHGPNARESRVLTLAGREADIVGILTTAVATGTVVHDAAERLADSVAQKLAWVQEGAEERRARYAFFYSVVSDRNLDGAAPLVARLATR